MAPMDITSFFMTFRRRNAIAFQPALDIEEINLFPPQHASEGAPLNQFFFLGRSAGMDGFVKFVSVFLPFSYNFVDVGKRVAYLLAGRLFDGQVFVGQAQPVDNRAS